MVIDGAVADGQVRPGRALALRKVIPLDVVETIREGLLVLEPDLTVRFANRSF
jgi:hypothetical protein